MNGAARAQRVLIVAAISLVGLTVLAFVAILLAPTFGVTDATAGIWPTVFVFPLLALPVAFLMIAVSLIMAWSRRKP